MSLIPSRLFKDPSDKTWEDLEDEAETWFAGEKDLHDHVIDDYVMSVEASKIDRAISVLRTATSRKSRTASSDLDSLHAYVVDNPRGNLVYFRGPLTESEAKARTRDRVLSDQIHDFLGISGSRNEADYGHMALSYMDIFGRGKTLSSPYFEGVKDNDPEGYRLLVEAKKVFDVKIKEVNPLSIITKSIESSTKYWLDRFAGGYTYMAVPYTVDSQTDSKVFYSFSLPIRGYYAELEISSSLVRGKWVLEVKGESNLRGPFSEVFPVKDPIKTVKSVFSFIASHGLGLVSSREVSPYIVS